MASSTSLARETGNDDPNMLSWSQYLHDSDKETPSDSEDDFRGDNLNDADWDGQSRGDPVNIPC
jgi:hypothetical protein